MNIVLRNIFLPGMLALLLVACGPGGNNNVRPDQNRFKNQGLSLYQQQDYFLAAESLSKAFEALPRDREVYIALLDSWLQLGEYARVWQLINQNDLAAPEVQIIEANLQQQQSGCDSVINLLSQFDTEVLSIDWQKRYWQILASCQQNLGEHLSAALSYISLSELVEDVITRQKINDTIVQNLIAVEEEALILIIGNETDALTQGWLEAAYIKFGADGISGEGWLSNWSDHPAANYFLDMNQVSSHQKVAVMLPFSGKFAEVAKAVQKGFLAAALADTKGLNELIFFDTGSAGENLSTVFYSAQEYQSDMIIGPLDKASIEVLEQMPEATVPIILLNQSESNYYQFTLSPEGEAEIVAERMVADGMKNVLIMAPNDEWGERMTKAFAQRFVDLGGQIKNNTYFQPEQNDYSAQLRQLLGLVESQLRAKNLQQFLKLPVNSEEVVRSDVDAVFLAAKPSFARLMIPQLKFHRAAELPVYSTSHVFAGLHNEQHNKDLEGVKFAVSPIELEPTALLEQLPFELKLVKSDKRLFAFGYDAYQLISRLGWMSRVHTGMVEGLTGNIRIGFDGKFSRELLWAQYRNGSIVPLTP
ncbi:MAG: penicillin-binding protein activator [Xanthomonadales bacterium]|nr:penicillin-binding protein activator [Xanthomonadales bacterium]